MEKKNLILKIIFSSLLMVLFLGLLYGGFKFNFLNTGLYSQNKFILADEDEAIPEKEYEELKCSHEIPIGEAMEKTFKLLQDIVYQLDIIQGRASFQIVLAEQMIELANQCDTDECRPIDCWATVEESCECCEYCSFSNGNGDPIPNGEGGWYTGECVEPNRDEDGIPVSCPTNGNLGENCVYHLVNCDAVTVCNPPEPCTSPWYYEGEYRACPQEEIEERQERIVSLYNQIVAARQEVWGLIDENRESLCDKLNEDIRTVLERIACAGCPEFENPLCPNKTIIEIIRRKLYLSRGELDVCQLAPEDWDRIEEGKMIGKFLFNCPLVAREDFARYTKTMEEIGGEQVPVCTSLHNWFCCSDSP